MLEFLRKHTVIVMAAVAAVFIGLVFLDKGGAGGSMMNTSTPVFKYADKSYTVKDYNEKYSRYYEFVRRLPSLQSLYNQMIGMTRVGLRDNEYNIMLYSVILREEAARYGIYPGKEEIENMIRLLPDFRDENGKFNLEAYENMTSLGGKSYKQQNEAALREAVADIIRFQALVNIIADNIGINDNFARIFFESGAQSMDVNTAFLTELNYRPTTEPTTEQIKEFWEKRVENYQSDELRDVTVYLFKPKAAIETGGKNRIPAATLEILNPIETLWQDITDRNAKGLDELIEETVKGQEKLLTMEKIQLPAVTQSKKDGILSMTINSAVDPTQPTVSDIAFNLARQAAPVQIMGEDGKPILNKPAKAPKPSKEITADNVSTTLVLDDGTIALVTVSNIVPAGALPFDLARPSARRDLLDEMTEQNLQKAASELREKLAKEAKTPEQFKSIAEGAKAKVDSWTSVGLLSIPPGMIDGKEIFYSLRKVNDNGISGVIYSPTEGATIAQLVKRTIPDTPEMRRNETVSASDALNTMKSMLVTDWLRDTVKRNNLQLTEPYGSSQDNN